MRSKCNQLLNELETISPGVEEEDKQELNEDIMTLRRYVVNDKEGNKAFKLLQKYGLT